MVKSEKTSLYLLSIVAIVAVVGIVIVLNQGQSYLSSSEEFAESSLAGEAYRSAGSCGDGICQSAERRRKDCTSDCPPRVTCTDSDGGSDTETSGEVTGSWLTTWATQTFADQCNPDGRVMEGYCTSGGYAYYNTYDCEAGTSCEDGVCVTDVDAWCEVYSTPEFCLDDSGLQDGILTYRAGCTSEGHVSYIENCHASYGSNYVCEGPYTTDGTTACVEQCTTPGEVEYCGLDSETECLMYRECQDDGTWDTCAVTSSCGS